MSMQKSENMLAFINMVRKMRLVQASYFSAVSYQKQSMLVQAKSAEREVDEWLKSFERDQKATQARLPMGEGDE